jgi:hypothetical protein
MTNDERDTKIHNIDLAVTRIEGNVQTLTTAVNSYVKASEKAEVVANDKIGEVSKRVTSMERKMWGAVTTALTSALGVIAHWIRH